MEIHFPSQHNCTLQCAPSMLPSAAVTGPVFPLLLRCAERRLLSAGECLHAYTIKTGFFSSVISLGNAVVNLYSKCGCLSAAAVALSDMPRRDAVSYNSLINSLSSSSCSSSAAAAFQFVRTMLSETLMPNSFTLAGILTSAIVGSGGREAHCLCIKTANVNDVFVSTSLINMYCKTGFLNDARKVFDSMPYRNSVTWAALISGYSLQKHGHEAFQLFRLVVQEADSECKSSEFIYTSLLSSLCDFEFLQMGRQIHCLSVKNGLSFLSSVGNSLVTFYAKCKSIDDAVMIFDFLDDKNTITWSAVVSGCAQNGESEKALNFFLKMRGSGITPTEYTFVGVINACSDLAALAEGKQVHSCLLKLGFENQLYSKSSLVDMYAKCGSIDDAWKLFDELDVIDDVVVWTAMIGGYVQNGEYEQALSLYGRMEKEGILPNTLTIASVLRACSNLTALEQGKQIQARAVKYGFSLGIPIGSALSTLYAKCGILGDCNLVFRKMPQRDVIAWNSIISGFAQNGHGMQALDLFEEMKREGIEPNDITFINILNCCSHMGLIKRGWKYFTSMSADHSISPRVEHYACMVDMLTRAGNFKDAKDFVESVPIDHGVALWRIVLGACRNSRDFDIGAYAGEKLMELGSQESSAYTLLSNIYAAQCRWDDVERVRRIMRGRMVNKEPGCSWIEIQNRVHVFVVGEQQHPETERIYAEVKQLLKHMKDEGYKTCAIKYALPSLYQSQKNVYGSQNDKDKELISCLAF